VRVGGPGIRRRHWPILVGAAAVSLALAFTAFGANQADASAPGGSPFPRGGHRHLTTPTDGWASVIALKPAGTLLQGLGKRPRTLRHAGAAATGWLALSGLLLVVARAHRRGTGPRVPALARGSASRAPPLPLAL